MLRRGLWLLVIIGAAHVPMGFWYAIVTDPAQSTLAIVRLRYAFTSVVVGALVALAALALLNRELLLEALRILVRRR